MRQYWKNFLKDIEVLVYVIDGSDLDRFGESISALKTLLNTDGVKKNPVYIVLNKSVSFLTYSIPNVILTYAVIFVVISKIFLT